MTRLGATACDSAKRLEDDWGSRGRGFESRQPDHQTCRSQGLRIPTSTPADATPSVAVTFVGAVGVPTVMGAVALDCAPVPQAFLAAILNV